MSKLRNIISAILLVVLTASCGSGNRDGNGGDTACRLPDTLRVATLYSPTSFFYYRDENMGFDYSLVSALAREKGMELDLTVAPSLAKALDMLDSGKVDVVAYEVPVTAESRRRVVFTGPENLTHQVLVQPRGEDVVRDVTGLVGKDIYVPADSKYFHRLRNLDSELGGGIKIHAVDPDSITEEDLLDKVAAGELPMTVVDSDIALLNKTYYPGLDITLALSFDQKSQWAVSPRKAWLADSISAYFGGEAPQRAVSMEYRRYYELSKANPSALTMDFSGGRISAYDALFRKYAGTAGVDWRLLAAMGFVESGFDSNLVSWAGARGIMQIMPSVAQAHGVSPGALVNPETSVKLAGELMASLETSLAKHVPDPAERQLFKLAAYNSGIAHILDGIALARKYGMDPQKWYGNVEKAVLMKSRPEYYNDPVVKYGYFRGRQTTEYVRKVTEFYKLASKSVPPE